MVRTFLQLTKIYIFVLLLLTVLIERQTLLELFEQSLIPIKFNIIWYISFTAFSENPWSRFLQISPENIEPK